MQGHRQYHVSSRDIANITGNKSIQELVVRIAISGRTETVLKSTTTALQKQHPKTRFTYFVAGITDTTVVKSMFDSFGAVDVLINNTGYPSLPEELKIGDPKEWQKSFEINILGTVFVTQTYLRTKSADQEGVIVILNTVTRN
jgi:NADP-dependent 3-hydroxy acid dehydrogenase YdfG